MGGAEVDLGTALKIRATGGGPRHFAVGGGGVADMYVSRPEGWLIASMGGDGEQRGGRAGLVASRLSAANSSGAGVCRGSRLGSNEGRLLGGGSAELRLGDGVAVTTAGSMKFAIMFTSREVSPLASNDGRW